MPVSSTRQTLTFTVCLTPAHGKGHAVHKPLLKRQRVHDVAVCCPEAHGKEQGSPCANLWLTAKFDGVEPQSTAVNVDGRPAHVEPASPCVVVGAHGEFNLGRVPVREHTANLIFAVCFCFAGVSFSTHGILALRRVPKK